MTIERKIENEKETFVSNRLVVKIGSSSITNSDGSINEKVMNSVVKQISHLYINRLEIVLVLSGAVRYGEKLLKEDSEDIVGAQVAAIFGQPRLISKWIETFENYGVLAGEILFSEDDLHKPNTPIIESLKHGIPIVNANDAINDEEMKQYFLSSDNDKLSLHIFNFINADSLLILTDVEGILKEGKLVTKIDTEKVSDFNFQGKSNRGTGGMQSKAEVAFRAAKSGGRVAIANSNRGNVIVDFAKGINVGTNFKK